MKKITFKTTETVTKRLLSLVLIAAMFFSMGSPCIVRAEEYQDEPVLVTAEAAETGNETEVLPEVVADDASVDDEEGPAEVGPAGADEEPVPVQDDADVDAPGDTDGAAVVDTPEKAADLPPVDTADTEVSDTVEKPAQNFEKKAGEILVSVVAPAGAFPDGTEMKATPVSDKDTLAAISEVANCGNVVAAVDISFWYDSKEIEPDLPIQVSLKSEEIATLSEPQIVHVDDEGGAELVKQAEIDTDEDEVAFESAEFSVYAIVGDQLPQPPRVTYDFKNTDGSDYHFTDTAEQDRTSQIIKNGEVVQEVGFPTIGEGQTFQGWYLYKGDGSGTSIGELPFGSAITIAYGEAGSGSVVGLSSVTIDPEELNDDGTYHVTVKAYCGEVVYITFYEDAAGNNILTKHQIPKGDAFDIATQEVNAPEAELAFIGWNEQAGTNDDARTPITNTNITFNADKSYYPIFKSGHWINFYAGATGSGATYTAPVFVPAGVTASSAGAQPSNPSWKGYTFQYWTETNLYTGNNGAYVQPSSAPARFNFNNTLSEGKTLYAYWTPASTTYTVVFWRQNVTDSKTANDAQKTYSFAGQETKTGTTGTTVYATDYSGYKSADGKIDFSIGFNLNSNKSDTSVEVKADGTSIINIYFDRQTITMQFYNNNGNAPNNGYTSNVWTNGSQYVTTYTGLYGQTWVQAGYSGWPALSSGRWVYYTTGNSTKGMTFLGQFVLPDDVRDTTGQLIRMYRDNTTNYTVNFYLQNTDGTTYPTTPSDVGHGSSGATFYFSEKYDGFTVVQYRRYRNNTYENWQTAAVGGSVSLSGGWNGNYNLEVRYARKHYTLKYLDSVDSTELSGISTADIVYGASLTGYKPNASYVPVSQYPGKVWDGKWYKDKACSEEFDWTVTMPNDNMVVYAGWEDVYYKIDVDPNGGTLTSSESTFFWLTYGQTIQRYDDVTRDYAEDANGNYKYENWLRQVYESEGYDPWDYEGYLRSAGYVTNSANTTSELHEYAPGDDVGPLVTTISYPYDSTRYRYEKGAYALIGWYEIQFEEGHYGDLAYKTGETLYTFGTGVTHDTYIQAKWRRVGEYHIEYKEDVYLMVVDENENVSISPSEIDTSGMPTDSNSYADHSESAILGSPTSPIVTGTGDDAKQYVFKGWYYNGKLYTPGDVYEILASLAEDKVVGQDPDTGEDIIQKTIYIYPVYQSVENLPVDATHIYWYSNFKDTDGNQISNLTVTTQYKDETADNIQPNESIDIPKIADVIGTAGDYEGYSFKGWARVPNDTDVTADTFNANNFMYLYWDGTDFHVDSVSGAVVTEVAADENTPYHDMYAVWEINKYTVTVTKTVVSMLEDDQHIPFTFAPVSTTYSASNFVLTGENEYVYTDPETGSSFTYYNHKELLEVPYGTEITLTENEEDDFTISAVKETVTTNADGSVISNPSSVERTNGYKYTIKGDVTIEYTNTRKTGSLKINKATDPSGIANTKNFRIAVKNSDGKYLQSESAISFDTTIVYFNVSVNAPKQIDNLPLGTYSIEEDTANGAADVDGYRFDGVTYSETSVEVAETNTEENPVAITATNSYTKLVSATVTKTLVDAYPNGTTEFAFTATLTEGGNDVTATYLTSYLTNGKFTLTPAGSGDTKTASVTFENLPVGTVLTVTEDSYAMYTTTGDNGEGKTLVDGTNEIKITNTRKTQKVRIFKVDDSPTPVALSGVEFTLNNETLATGTDGYTAEIELPIGGTFTLTESKAKDHYDPLKGTVSVSVGTDGTVTCTAEDQDDAKNVSVIATVGGASTIKVVNPRTRYTINIKKQVAGNMGDVNRNFSFTVTYTIDGTPTTENFTLKHGGNPYSIENIPYGSSITITETSVESDGYTTQYSSTVTQPNFANGSTFNFSVSANEDVTFLNTKTATPDTGVDLDALPYLLMLAFAAIGEAMFVIRRRKNRGETA